jgi:peptidoglycan/LPS O-acetylase OafA/YrhL
LPPDRPAAGSRLAPLDGIRALAVTVVLGYHSGVPGLRVGGFYGQDGFFVLSGFLITSLLLAESDRRGTIELVAFWGRRARRLLPALVAMIVVVAVYVAFIAAPGEYPSFRSDAVATLLYAANWHFIGSGSDYFASSSAPSLLTHTWSLSIEEQFYILWPPALVAVLGVARRRHMNRFRVVGTVAGAGAVASAGWMAYLSVNGASLSRLYYGTDTHCQCLLVGVVLAAVVGAAGSRADSASVMGLRVTSPVRRRLLGAVSMVGMVGLAVTWVAVSERSPYAFEGGFLVVAVLAAAVIVGAVTVPRLPLGAALSFRPLAAVGVVSYGMYLWFLPVFAVVDGSSTGLQGWSLFAVRYATVTAIATVSYFLVERPARSARWLRGSGPGLVSSIRPALIAGVAVLAATGVVMAAGAGAAPVQQVSPTIASGTSGPAGASATTGRRGILVVGDSTGFTLGLALSDGGVEEDYDVGIDNGAQLGCGLAVSAAIREHGVNTRTAPACNPATPADRLWPALLASDVGRLHPDYVLVAAGRWELFDRQATGGGPWQDILQPADAAYVEGQLRLAISVAASAGAHVGVATAPCFSSGEQDDGMPWPEDSPARVAAYNRLVEDAVAADRSRASVVTLDADVCPDGHFHTSIGGVVVRAPDGVHYPFFSIRAPGSDDPDSLTETEQFGQWIAARVIPQLTAAT